MFAVSSWHLLLGRSNACDAALEAKLNTAIYNTTVEHDGCEEVTFEGRVFV